MFQPHCPKLSALAKLLREQYNVGLALLARDASEEERLRADADVLRINRQIGWHLRSCGQSASTSTFPIATPLPHRPIRLDLTSQNDRTSRQDRRSQKRIGLPMPDEDLT